MQNTSSRYKRLIKQSGRQFRVKINCTLANGESMELTDNDIMQDSLKLLSSVSGESSFEVGSAIIGELDFEIDNASGQYDNTTFDNAELTVYIGLVVNQSYTGDLTVEWLKKGVFTVEEVTVNEKYLAIIAYDNMAKFDRELPELAFPIMLSHLFRQICTHCGVAYTSLRFPNSDLTIPKRLLEQDTSCREVLSYIAQLACSYACIRTDGSVSLQWFADTEYEVTDKQRLNGTVSVTGVQFTDVDNNPYLLGSTDYCLMIDDNPLVIGSQALQSNVWTQRLIGFSLTPFETEILSDPSIEAGDIVTVSDLKGNTYRTPVTSVTFLLDGKTSLSCHADTIKENQRTRSSVSAKVMAAVRREAKRQISEYDIRAKMFSTLTANAMGYYQTEQIQDDGSVIIFQHDKPHLEESQHIWKKSLDSFAVSSDGGQTWRGMDSNGNAVLNLLAVEGIVADWIKAGTLQGITIIAQNGQIAGWTIQGNTLISSDGTMVLDGSNNTITVNDSSGVKFMQIKNGGVTYFRPDENDVMKEIGSIGVTKAFNADTYGITFNLKDGDAMTWSVYDSQAQGYVNKLRYEKNTDKLIFNCDIGIYSQQFAPTNIVVNGQTYTVLAKV